MPTPSAESGFYVTAPLIWPLVMGLRVLGLDVDVLLREAGIARDILTVADARVPAERALLLVKSAVTMSGDPNLGLHLAQRYEPGVFGTLDHLAHSARNLREAIQVLARYERLHQNGMRTHLTEEGDRATITHVMLHRYALPRQVSENTLANLLVIGRKLTGIDFEPLAVSLTHPSPADPSEHARFFRCPIEWNAEHDVLVFPRTVLDAALLHANPRLAAVLDQHAYALLSDFESQDSFVHRVRHAICAELPKGNTSLERVAEALELSPRTLQRRLKEQGTRLELVLADLRHALAREYLAQPRLGTADVALMLGFSDDRAFRRAFRRWTDMSPAEFRKTLGAKRKRPAD